MIMKKILKLAVYSIVAMVALSSCSDSDDYPSQKDIETKIIGKWKEIVNDGMEVLTNDRLVKTFITKQEGTYSTSRYFEGEHVWQNKLMFKYEVKENNLYESFVYEDEPSKIKSKITSIDENKLCENDYEYLIDGEYVPVKMSNTFQKVTVDYSKDIIGMWEGVEMTGEETFGDINHRIEYKADGTYTYYDKDGDSWKPSTDVDNEYNIDGDWLTSRWRVMPGADYDYESWDIIQMKNGIMKWSGLREKTDHTRYTATFTWKKVQ